MFELHEDDLLVTVEDSDGNVKSLLLAGARKEGLTVESAIDYISNDIEQRVEIEITEV